jgi:hypothetical protein
VLLRIVEERQHNAHNDRREKNLVHPAVN